MTDVAVGRVLSDEELAAINARHAAVHSSYTTRRPAIDHINTCHGSVNDVPALVAEVKRLRGNLASVGEMAKEDYARAEMAEAALVACRAEVARLRASITECSGSCRVDD